MLGIQALAPGVIRTHNLLIRSQMLYPIELRVRLKGRRVLVGEGKSRVGSGGPEAMRADTALDRFHVALEEFAYFLERDSYRLNVAAILQIARNNQVVLALFYGSLGYVEEAHFVCFPAFLEPFGDICGDRYAGSSHLRRQRKNLVFREMIRKAINGKDVSMCLLPNNKVFEGSSRRSHISQRKYAMFQFKPFRRAAAF
jgi:hypothetical protein